MINDLKKKIKGFSNFLIAYSGGLDSSVLMHQLVKLKNDCKLNLRAMHIHHGLENDADHWVKHCQTQCKYWKVPLIVQYVHVKNKKKGIEDEARKVRYYLLFKHLKKKEILLTGHHLNDQCETFFLALKRGSGPYGLSSMPDIREFSNNKKLLRPLLNQDYEKIKFWAKKYDLSWIEDISNKNIKYDRNFLRKKILPKIYNRWPYFPNSVYRSALICREQESLIDELLSKSLKKLIRKDGSLTFNYLKEISEVHRNAIIRRWIILTINIIPSFNIFNIIWKELINSRKDASPIIKINKYEIRRYRNAIYLIPITKCLKNSIVQWNKPFKSLLLPQNLGKLILNNIKGQKIRKPHFKEKVTVRFFYHHSSVYILGNNKKQKIKKIWQKFSIPIWERKRTPMIFYNDTLICILGLLVTHDAICKRNSYCNVLWMV